jgi:CRISPR/Cas system-associated exonuclease Cas4 (RecB family)
MDKKHPEIERSAPEVSSPLQRKNDPSWAQQTSEGGLPDVRKQMNDKSEPSPPFGANIEPDPETNTRLINNLSGLYSKTRQAIHVSDLTLCMRQAAFRKLKPKPTTETELGFYLAGNGHHTVLESLHGAEREVERTWHEVHAHFDLLDSVPVEIKTTRDFSRRIHGHWVRQLAYYCVIENVNTGKLIVLFLFPRRRAKGNDSRGGMIETYTITLRDLETVRSELLERRDILSKALEARHPGLAPGVKDDEDCKWLCRNCAYRVECEAIQK